MSASIFDSKVDFAQFNLPAGILRGLAGLGWSRATLVQKKAIEVLPKARNLIAQAHNGSGKTGAFCLAMILSVDLSINMPQAICLCTTSEIAEQVALTCAEIAKYSDIKVYCATKISANESALGLHGKAHIIVGTPGTVFRKLIQNREFDPKGIRMMVLDEADVMLTNTQNGLSSQVWSIFSELNQGQTRLFMFSATFPKEVREFALAKAPDAMILSVRTKELSLRNIKQFALHCLNDEQRFQTLMELYSMISVAGQTIIFCNSKDRAKKLSDSLNEQGFRTEYITGDLTPLERREKTNQFREGKICFLIASDVYSRGVDFPTVACVINYDVPVDYFSEPQYSTWLHRNGRAGRLGRLGISITITIDKQSEILLRKISDYFGTQIQEKFLDSSDEENMKGIYDVVLSIQQSWESEEDEEQMKTFSYEESNQFPSELGTEMICEDSGLLLEED